jgi:membrane associated rhomboid family serine protease
MKSDDPIQRLYVVGLVFMVLGIVAGLLLGAIELYRLIPTIYAMVVANRLASVAISAAVLGAVFFCVAIALDTREYRRKIGRGR